MSLQRISGIERILTHAALIFGCVIFAFPFIWMLGTSAKVPRELAVDRIRLLPRTPVARVQTPYMAQDEFPALMSPDGIPEPVWEKARPLLDTLIADAITAWKPDVVGASVDNPPPAPGDAAVYRNVMTQGVYERLSERLSDTAREAAIVAENTARTVEGKPAADGGDWTEELRAEAIAAGVEALVANARELIDDSVLRSVFDASYRRICLGTARVRLTDYRSCPLNRGDEWKVLQGEAVLVSRGDLAPRYMEVRRAAAQGVASDIFSIAPDPAFPAQNGGGALSVDQIDRLFLNYRGDASWARISFEVFRNGQRYVTSDRLYLFERDWYEQELRFPGKPVDPMERRNYMLLQPAGSAPEGSPPLEIRVHLDHNTSLGAWVAKATRNYLLAFREVPYARYLMTSFSLAILNILLAVFSCTLTAYAFARLEWPGRDFCFAMLLATMMIPPQVTMIPSFLIMKLLGWYGTLLPLWVPSGFGAAFFIFLVRQFLKNVPGDLEDAARIDGCGFLRIYWHVMLPLVKPTTATIAVFTFLGSWNNFMSPLIFINDERLFPLALGLFRLNLRSGSEIGLIMAGAFIMALPIILLFLFVQRYFIQGISLTGSKN